MEHVPNDDWKVVSASDQMVIIAATCSCGGDCLHVGTCYKDQWAHNPHPFGR